MFTLKILRRSLLVSQSEIFHCINEIHLNYHSTNLLLYFIDSGIDLFSNSTKVWLKGHVWIPMYKLDSPIQNVARVLVVTLRYKLKYECLKKKLI